MLRKMMLAGLLSATVLGSIAPAYAQSDQGQRGRMERAGRGDSGPGADARPRGRDMAQSRGEGRPQWSQSRSGQGDPSWNRGTPRGQPGGTVGAVRPSPNWTPSTPSRPQSGAQWQQQRGAQQPDRNWQRNDRGDRQDWANGRRDDRQNGRYDRRDDRQDWRNDRRDNRQDWRNDRGNWNNGGNWNNNRRYDDRTRWSNQRRWDNGWRNDRRYDWSSYRSRYGDRYRIGRYYAPRGWDYGYRRFSIGVLLNGPLYGNNYWINDPFAYRLPPSYGTLRWVRYFDDAMLVDVRDGYVVDVIHDFFW